MLCQITIDPAKSQSAIPEDGWPEKVNELKVPVQQGLSANKNPAQLPGGLGESGRRAAL